MPRRCLETNSSDEPPRKKSFCTMTGSNIDIKCGDVLLDIVGNQWKLGKSLGIGGFGVIYAVTQETAKDTKTESNYVAKIETHSSGPLFVEVNCYLRIAKKEMIDQWKREKLLSNLGMPHYVSSGSHINSGNKYRFLIMPRYEKDLDTILQQKKKLNLKTVLLISGQILDVLEYIHSKGYIHADVKASNIMLNTSSKLNPRKTKTNHVVSSRSPKGYRYPRVRSCRKRNVQEAPLKRTNLRPIGNIYYGEDLPYLDLDDFLNSHEKVVTSETPEIADQIYLLDYGLASKYTSSNGEHKHCSGDERKAHAGTLLFCSRDAHKGVQSRRSDLESLAYNMVYWLTSTLPWADDIDNPVLVERKKKHSFSDIEGFLYFCFPDPPRVLKEFFNYLKKLDIKETPNYEYCRGLFKKGIKDHGYIDNNAFDFDNLEGWGAKQKKTKCGVENKRPDKLIDNFKRPPLLSNIAIVPLLRKKIKTKKAAAALNWSRILFDPEVLLKQSRERKLTDGSESPASPIALEYLDLESLNPTPAMKEVFDRYEEKCGLSPRSWQPGENGDCPEGFTPAMFAVWQKMMEEKAMQESLKPSKKKTVRKTTKRTCKKVSNGLKESLPSKKTKNVPFRRTYSLRG